MSELQEINAFLRDCLKKHAKVLKPKTDSKEKFEVYGTIEAMQGKKKVDGFYFSTILSKPKDVRFYFFPLYTHADQLVPTLSDELKKQLKGKTCFHMKNLNPALEKEIKALVKKSVSLYQQDGLLAKK